MASTYNSIDDIVYTLNELRRLHQLNFELLEQLHVTISWIFEHGIPLPNLDTLHSLCTKAKSLLIEIQSENPKILQYSSADEKKQHFRTDEDETEPTPRVGYAHTNNLAKAPKEQSKN
jgi:hypothetical protein